MVASLPSVGDLWRAAAIAPRRRYGQHFLLAEGLLRRIARAGAPFTDTVVCDIGAGHGALSCVLLEMGAYHVVAIEQDKRCLPSLERLRACADGRLTVIGTDVLRFPLCQHIRSQHGDSRPIKVVANIPYHLSSPLLRLWLRDWRAYASLTVTAQKDFVLRLAADSGSNYGRLSVSVQRVFHVEPLFSIKRQAFFPPPRVESHVVRLRPRAVPLAELDEALLQRILRAAFGKRRKMVKTALGDLGIDKPVLARWLAAAQIDGNKRAEQLTRADFYRLVACYDSVVSD